MSELERIIANLGYPVGMGMAPSPADLARMKSAIMGDNDIWVGLERAKDVRNAAIEECAVVLETFPKDFWGYTQDEVIAAIRALKDKP